MSHSNPTYVSFNFSCGLFDNNTVLKITYSVFINSIVAATNVLIYLDLQLYLASFKRDLAIEITNSPIINSHVNLLDFMQLPP